MLTAEGNMRYGEWLQENAHLTICVYTKKNVNQPATISLQVDHISYNWFKTLTAVCSKNSGTEQAIHTISFLLRYEISYLLLVLWQFYCSYNTGLRRE